MALMGLRKMPIEDQCPKVRRRRGRVLGLFMLLTATACQTVETPTESTSLQGARNFRDIGGYITDDGRRVKTGLLFRSDNLGSLTRVDFERLDELGVRQVIDMRAEVERNDAPNLWPQPVQANVTVSEITVLYPRLDPRESRRKILTWDVEDEYFHELMVEANRSLAVDFTGQWAEIFRGFLSRDGLPAVVHCVEGKDRTGFIVAVVLRTLGVPEETVMADYLRSNDRLEARINRLSVFVYLGTLFQVTPDQIRPLLEVRREYLEAAFQAIDEQYGSFENYLKKGLGLSNRELAQLRDRLLE